MNLVNNFNAANPFDVKAINEKLDQLEITQKGLLVTTKYAGVTKAEKEVSEAYQLFDFNSFAKQMIAEATPYINPSKFNLKFFKGRQELSLFGDQIEINGEVHYKMLSILNSSDKSRALQINMGLLRQVCSNGLVAGVAGEHTSVKTKHYKTTLPGQVEVFMNGIVNFNSAIDSQAALIETLASKTISFSEIAKQMVYDAEEKLVENKINRLKAFGTKLMKSSTDALPNLTAEQIKLLSNPLAYLSNSKKISKKADVQMTGSQAFHAYTEIFRNRDTNAIRRETDKILTLIG